MHRLREAVRVACYFLWYRYTWKPGCRVSVHKCTNTPLLITLFIKKENKTYFVCESVLRSGVLLHLCSETWPPGSLSVPRRRALGPNPKRLLFLTPGLALRCILQRQIPCAKWRRFTLQKLKQDINVTLHSLSQKCRIKKDLPCFCA